MPSALGISSGTNTSIITEPSRKQPRIRKNTFTTSMNRSCVSFMSAIVATRCSARSPVGDRVVQDEGAGDQQHRGDGLARGSPNTSRSVETRSCGRAGFSISAQSAATAAASVWANQPDQMPPSSTTGSVSDVARPSTAGSWPSGTYSRLRAGCALARDQPDGSISAPPITRRAPGRPGTKARWRRWRSARRSPAGSRAG